MTEKRSSWADFLWGPFSRLSYLLIAAAVLLLVMLGARELWTQEHRWADIVSGMFFRHDFFHPYLGSNDYYDKPLLSYWLIAFISVLTQQLNTWVLRLPSALAGLLTVWSIYRLGWRLKDKSFGLLCGWLLLTTYYFVFWSRISSADMLNLAGSLFAVYWYMEKRDDTRGMNYAVFFLILAMTSLCKGLVGAVVPLIAILPDVLHEQRWRKHLNWNLLWSPIPALVVYVFPFVMSSHFGAEGYGQNGLYLVYRENVLRYFHPFDHKDPIYTYFIFLPIYLLPWSVFLLPALVSLKSRWSAMTWNSRWIVWAFFLLFVFFTFSGSRRSYYVLPIVPFAILLMGDWLTAWMQQQANRPFWLGRSIAIFFVLLFGFFGVFQPLFYAQGGHRLFAQQLQNEATKAQPWDKWNVVLLDPESKVAFYLKLPPQVKYLGIAERDNLTLDTLSTTWPVVMDKPKDVIFISRKRYAFLLQQLLPHYKQVVASKTLGERLFHMDDEDAAIAFIPLLS